MASSEPLTTMLPSALLTSPPLVFTFPCASYFRSSAWPELVPVTVNVSGAVCFVSANFVRVKLYSEVDARLCAAGHAQDDHLIDGRGEHLPDKCRPSGFVRHAR